jgi:hypothetical protein
VTGAEIEGLADSVRSVLWAADGGSLELSSATRHRLEGALTALEAVLGEPSSLLSALGVESK